MGNIIIITICLHLFVIYTYALYYFILKPRIERLSKLKKANKKWL